ncbi:C-terminal binding protein [Oscillospiraceae bacterium LTW-04]|nr:C-terminal binding protein [Oscillospiraceae bacterium MB24-C1]
MFNAVVVDSNYGSVSKTNLDYISKMMLKNNIHVRLEHYLSEDELISGCKDADAILATGNPPITSKVLHSLPRLKMVQRFGIGVNSIDLEAASETNTLIMFMPNFCVDELATHAMSLILGLLRNAAYYDRNIRKGKWPKASYFLPSDMSSMVIGLFGFGGSARPLYKMLHDGFGSKVISCDPFVTDDVKKDFDVEFVSFDDLLKRSDIISLHAPLNDKTKHIFNSNAFGKMKESAMIINIARGGLIDEKALISALQNKEIRFAGLDVFEQEPISPENPLLKMENVMLTCHSAFYGEKSQKTQIELAISLTNDVLNNKSVSEKYIANRSVIARDLVKIL